MRFVATSINGAFIIEPDRVIDNRGFFSRVFCANEFVQHGLESKFVQSSVSHNHKAYTLRGMHFQIKPKEEVKIVSCCSGAIFDVVVDLRKESPSYRQWFGVELTHTNGKAVYVPSNCAHGFMTLVDASEVFYQINAFFAPDLARGFRWDDADVNVAWPCSPRVISIRDQNLPSFSIAVEDVE